MGTSRYSRSQRDDCWLAIERSGIFLCEEGLNVPFDLIICALADMHITNPAPLINEVERGPVHVVVGIPGLAIVVLGDRIKNAILRDRVLEVVKVGLVAELREMIADKDEALVPELGIPVLEVGHDM